MTNTSHAECGQLYRAMNIYCRLYLAHVLIRYHLRTGRKYSLIKKYALNKHVHLLTRLYGMIYSKWCPPSNMLCRPREPECMLIINKLRGYCTPTRPWPGSNDKVKQWFKCSLEAVQVSSCRCLIGVGIKHENLMGLDLDPGSEQKEEVQMTM